MDREKPWHVLKRSKKEKTMADHWDHTVAVRAIWRAGSNMPDLTLELISLDNPWTRPRSPHGRRLWDLVLHPLCKGGQTATTFREIFEAAAKLNPPMKGGKHAILGHLAWLFTWGPYIRVGGQSYQATTPKKKERPEGPSVTPPPGGTG
jgi:hypothetical protein